MEKDRRTRQRTRIARPVYVQTAETDGLQFEEVRTMRDFSRDGLYFLTELSCYLLGMKLHVIPAFDSLNLEYVAEVVRIDRTWAGDYGVALRLLGVVEDHAGAPRTAAKSAFQSFALAAAPMRAASR